MTGLEALSLAANIMQLINFSFETIRLCKSVYDGASPDAFLGENAASLYLLSTKVQAHCHGRKFETSDERQLEEMARKCAVAARSLDEEVKFITGYHAKGSLRATLRVVLKTLWRQNRLKRLEGSLRRYQETMESHLLFRVCKQSDAIQLQHHEGYGKLDQSVQLFITQYAAGHKELTALVGSSIQSTKESTANEVRRVELTVSKHVSAKVTAAEMAITSSITAKIDQAAQKITSHAREHSTQMLSESQRERFLDSLRFNGMNERRHDVADSHCDTFLWIFGIPRSSRKRDKHRELYRKIYGPMAEPKSIDSSTTDATWDDFHEWLKSESNIYWISGKPGSGKSTLVKFLVASEHTRTALDVWKGGVVVLSHFFWKPGAKMQKSLRGLLCTLIYQAVSQSAPDLERAFASSPSNRDKRYATDWSARELTALLLDLLKHYSSPVCVFVDGLDEICQEDVLMLLKLVEDVRGLPNVKICVASRPEDPFLRCYGNHPHLRLHDLTKGDMRAYAYDIVLTTLYEGDDSQHIDSQRRFDFHIIDQIVWRDEGVFLWLQLVVRSLLRGWRNGDSRDKISARLRAFPNELSQLYDDMWTRMNEDSEIYRKISTDYFHILVAASLADKDDRLPRQRLLNDARCLSSNNFDTGLYDFTAIVTWSTPDGEFDTQRATTIDSDSRNRMCCETTDLIRKRCAGLVEVRYLPGGETRARVHFIHRTAFDWLTESEKGRRVASLQKCRPQVQYLRLAWAHVVCDRFKENFSSHHALELLQLVEDSSLRPEACHVLLAAWKIHDTKELSPTGFAARAVIAGYEEPALSLIVQAPNAAELAINTLFYILLLFVRFFVGLDGRSPSRHFLEALVSMGADSRGKGVDPLKWPVQKGLEKPLLHSHSPVLGNPLVFVVSERAQDLGLDGVPETRMDGKCGQIAVLGPDLWPGSLYFTKGDNGSLYSPVDWMLVPEAEIALILDTTLASALKLLKSARGWDPEKHPFKAMEALLQHSIIPTEEDFKTAVLVVIVKSKTRILYSFRVLDQVAKDKITKMARAYLSSLNNVPEEEEKRMTEDILQDLIRRPEAYEYFQGHPAAPISRERAGYTWRAGGADSDGGGGSGTDDGDVGGDGAHGGNSATSKIEGG